jgi:hypothetical protein
VLKRKDRAIFLELSAFAAGKPSPGGFSGFGLRENAVGLGKISPRVSRAQIGKLNSLAAAVASGKIAVPAGIR